MFGKLKDFYNVLKLGEQVSNPEFWKSVQSKGQPALAALIIAIVGLTKGTKYAIPLDDDTITYIAGGIFATTNWLLTHATSKKVGLFPANPEPVSVVQQEVTETNLPLQPLSSTAVADGLAALAKDRGRANRDKPFSDTQ